MVLTGAKSEDELAEVVLHFPWNSSTTARQRNAGRPRKDVEAAQHDLDRLNKSEPTLSGAMPTIFKQNEIKNMGKRRMQDTAGNWNTELCAEPSWGGKQLAHAGRSKIQTS